MKRLLFVLGFWLLVLVGLAFKSVGATNYVLDLSYTNALAVLNASANGDSIIFTNGCVSWTNYITITNSLKLFGSGTNASTGTGITNNSSDGDDPIFYLKLRNSNDFVRVSQFAFIGGTGGRGITVDEGYCTNMVYRVDHCYFNNLSSRAIYVYGVVHGLIDHCYVDQGCAFAIYGHHSINWRGWWPQGFGKTNGTTVEDCSFYWTNNVDETAIAQGQGSWVTFRNNVIIDTDNSTSVDPVIDIHGNQAVVDITLNSGTHRGTMVFECYSNYISVADGYSVVSWRGGMFTFHSNIVTSGTTLGIRAYETDAPCDYNFLTNWPGYDPHTNSYFWANTYNGADLTNIYVANDYTNFIVLGSNYWFEATNYTKLTYPHPLNTDPAEEEDQEATIEISDTTQTYDGTALSVTVTTTPAGLTNVVTYDGSADAPTNAGSYDVVVVIANTGYYGTNTDTLTISKATPTVSSWPTASAINVMQTLTNSTLTGGTASTAGAFAFTNPDYMPDAGTYSASVAFTPTDTDNFNSATGTVNVTVNGMTGKFMKASSGSKWMVYTNGKHLIINLSP